jgi:hypothetical protein
MASFFAKNAKGGFGKKRRIKFKGDDYESFQIYSSFICANFSGNY